MGYMTPDELSDFRSDIAVCAAAEVTPRDELILGMAHMAFLHTMQSYTKGDSAVKSNRMSIVDGLFIMYPDKNWGVLQDVADRIEKGVREYPDRFPGVEIEHIAGP